MSQKESSEYKRIHSLVYDWGIEHSSLLVLKTEEEQIKHFGKRIKDFTTEERRGYDDGYYDIEYYFEVLNPHSAEQAAECWENDDYCDN